MELSVNDMKIAETFNREVREEFERLKLQVKTYGELESILNKYLHDMKEMMPSNIKGLISKKLWELYREAIGGTEIPPA